jgi:type II secretion system protein N
MKRLGIIVLCVLLVFGAFWLGLMLNFPGDSVSRYIEGQVNRRQGFDLSLTMAELRWNRVTVAKAELRRRDNPQAAPLLTMHDIVIPITWRLIGGLPVRGEVGGDGSVEAFLPWRDGTEGWLEGTLVLQQVPLPEVFRPVTWEGRLRFTGRFELSAAVRSGAQLPAGRLEGTASDLVVKGAQVGTFALPDTRLTSLNLALETGRTVTLQTLEFDGDLKGSGSGTITPNLRAPRNTLLAVRAQSSFRNGWLEQLGTLKPVLESFMDRGRIVVSLEGTVGQPRLQPVRGGGQ